MNDVKPFTTTFRIYKIHWSPDFTGYVESTVNGAVVARFFEGAWHDDAALPDDVRQAALYTRHTALLLFEYQKRSQLLRPSVQASNLHISSVAMSLLTMAQIQLTEQSQPKNVLSLIKWCDARATEAWSTGRDRVVLRRALRELREALVNAALEVVGEVVV